ncbi:uncharacterized protein [Henckelia pumila]|uniref:uncharacterized protein n=1 Tax=Henckelia pumila TaxID=405737 RepID=UPI003C6DCA3F
MRTSDITEPQIEQNSVKVMPTVIVVHFDGRWEASEYNINKWNPGPNSKFAAIPLDGNTDYNDQTSYDDYFDLNIVSLDHNNISEAFDEADVVANSEEVVVANVDIDSETIVIASNEAVVIARNEADVVEMWILIARNEADVVANVDIVNDTFSFTDGSNLFVGQEFPNRDAVKKVLRRISLEACFEFETVKSSHIVYAVKCIVAECKWRIWTSKIKDSHVFSIRTYCNTHTCDLTGRSKRIRGASSDVVRDMLVNTFQGNPVSIAPKTVMVMIHNNMNADISYYKAWKGKKLADNILKGDPTKSFTLLPCYLQMVEKMNQGSITEICVNEENRFKYMFLAFGACVRGYQSMRKVVSIDGTWLKGKFNGVLLVASAQDGNYHQYPVAWGIVNVESSFSWSWFLKKLLEVVPDEDELVIISNRHQGIINAVSSVYRNAHHGHCTWHLSQNLKIRCKKKGATELFLQIEKIYKQNKFDIAYSDFRKRYPEAAQFLDERDTLDRWTRAYCPNTRYNIMTTNGVESINARLLEERKLPIISLLDSLQRLASSWFVRSRNALVAANTNLTPAIEGILRSRFTDA